MADQIIAGITCRDMGGGNFVPWPAWNFNRTTTATTLVLKATPGIFHGLLVTTGAAGTVTVYNNTAASGTVVLVVDTTLAGAYYVDSNNTIGVTAITTGTPTITYLYA